MAAKPAYIWDGSAWVQIVAADATNGQGVPTGGTSGQYLVKDTSTDYDTSWGSLPNASTSTAGIVQLNDTTNSTSTSQAATANAVKSAYDLANGAIAKTLVDAKGDLIAGTAADTVDKLTVGTNGYLLTANSAEATGLKWTKPLGTSYVSGRYYDILPSSNATLGLTQNRLFLIPFAVYDSITVTSLSCEVTTQGGTGCVMRLGLYNFDITDGEPGSLLVDAGTIAATTTGIKTISGLSVALTPGLYYAGVVSQGSATAGTLRAYNDYNLFYSSTAVTSGTSPTGGFYDDGITGALPNPPVITSDARTPRIVIGV